MATYRMADYGEDEAEGSTQGRVSEELLRDLGLDQLTREACLRGVFGELLDEPRPGGGEWTVTQVGPGRRSLQGSTTDS